MEYIKAHPDVNVYDLAYTLACRRSEFKYKASVGASSKQSLLGNMAAMVDKFGEMGKQPGDIKSGGILGVFTGQVSVQELEFPYCGMVDSQ